jgi:hypothetical protein
VTVTSTGNINTGNINTAPDEESPSTTRTPSAKGTADHAGIASGIDFTAPPVTTLDVNNLTQAIAPASRPSTHFGQ